MSVTMYGSSDDLIEIEGDVDEEFNPRQWTGATLLAFSDGNVLRIEYADTGVWRISPVVYGKGEVVIEKAPEDNKDNYSDRATIDGQLKWVVRGLDIAMAGS